MTTKLELAKRLQVTERTVYRYLGIASKHDDFIDDYPEIQGLKISSSKLSNYQVWVVEKIKLLFTLGLKTSQICPNGEIVNELYWNLSRENYFKETSNGY